MSKSRQIINMNDGGATKTAGDKTTLYSDGFGGCTAICAFSSKGLYALYHLRGIDDTEKHDLNPTFHDCNEPFRNWLKQIKEIAQDDEITFMVGTPTPFKLSRILVEDTHPAPGMQHYLSKLCHDIGIDNASIVLLNMNGIKSVAVSPDGLACIDVTGVIKKPLKATYQTDADLFKHLEWNCSQKVNFLTHYKNADPDGTLLRIYKLHLAAEKLTKKYETIFKQNNKGNKAAALNYAFAEELEKHIKNNDARALNNMTALPHFNAATSSGVLFKKVTELGRLYQKATSIISSHQTDPLVHRRH